MSLPSLCRLAAGRTNRQGGLLVRAMSHGGQAEAEADVAERTMAHVTKRVQAIAPSLIKGLAAQGHFIADGFLSNAYCETLRAEAVKLYENDPTFIKSQSTRWCPVENKQIYYDKHNVFSTQLQGGEAYYAAPRLHEYIVAMVKAIVPALQRGFPEAQLSASMASNKLAVCVGEGSAYDKHYDNSGFDDTRKVTVLYYLNPGWAPDLGGQFTIYNNETTSTVEPLGDRLLVFWSDRLVHSVQPSFAPRGKQDHRYALTLWLTATTPDAIVRDDAEIARHFGQAQDQAGGEK